MIVPFGSSVPAIHRFRDVMGLAGVTKVEGQFARGDAVIVRGPDTSEVGRGLIAYDAEVAEKIKGRSSPDVMAILGISGRSEMIHRDDLVVGG